MPFLLASGKAIPSSCFNPFNPSAPEGFWQEKKVEMEQCIATLLGFERPMPFLFSHVESISNDIDIDEELERRGMVGYCFHTDRDVFLCGLSRDASKLAFEETARRRNAENVIAEAATMIPIIADQAEKLSKTFKNKDGYTTRFGYSVNQLGPIPKGPSNEFFIRSIARGGPAQQTFVKKLPANSPNIITTRVGMRLEMVKKAELVSNEYCQNWRSVNRPRPTEKFHQNSNYVRCPFTLNNSLPKESNKSEVKLTSWETNLRAIEEDMMKSVFGMLPNVIWASILAKVMERTEEKLGEFDIHAFEKWIASGENGHPPKLGFPAKGCASRLLPKGAMGISPTKPMHDDNNGLISLGCWTSLTESDAEVDLVFLINGKEVSIKATRLRWVLFMGFLPHESRSADKKCPAKKPRLHHSSFVKPEVEYLATHILSNLPCEQGGDDWSIDFVESVNGLRDDIEIVPIARVLK